MKGGRLYPDLILAFHATVLNTVGCYGTPECVSRRNFNSKEDKFIQIYAILSLSFTPETTYPLFP